MIEVTKLINNIYYYIVNNICIIIHQLLRRKYDCFIIDLSNRLKNVKLVVICSYVHLLKIGATCLQNSFGIQFLKSMIST